MKSKFKNLDFGSIDLLSREQQAKIVGGYGEAGTPLVYCGYRVWYSSGGVYWNVTGQGKCDLGSIQACESANKSVVAANHPGHSSVISYGCWNGTTV